MKVEFNINDIDELSLGLFMANGEDEIGQFKMLTFGFIFFEINFINYI